MRRQAKQRGGPSASPADCQNNAPIIRTFCSVSASQERHLHFLRRGAPHALIVIFNLILPTELHATPPPPPAGSPRHAFMRRRASQPRGSQGPFVCASALPQIGRTPRRAQAILITDSLFINSSSCKSRPEKWSTAWHGSV